MIAMLRKLVAHQRWADDKVLQALHSQEDPPARALDLYRHILGAESVWLARILGEPSPLPVWPSFGLVDAERAAAGLHAGFDRLLEGLDAEGLERPIAYRNSAGRSFTTPLGDILLHVCLHGVNHRAQISQLLRQAHHPPVTTDYIEFVRGVPAATRTA